MPGEKDAREIERGKTIRVPDSVERFSRWSERPACIARESDRGSTGDDAARWKSGRDRPATGCAVCGGRDQCDCECCHGVTGHECISTQETRAKSGEGIPGLRPTAGGEDGTTNNHRGHRVHRDTQRRSVSVNLCVLCVLSGCFPRDLPPATPATRSPAGWTGAARSDADVYLARTSRERERARVPRRRRDPPASSKPQIR